MNRRPRWKPNFKTPWRAFYVPAKKFAGAGIKDGAGNSYIVAPGGNLVKLES